MLTNCMRLWRQAHFVSQNSNTELLEIELKCSKFARGCGPKHVWTSKVLKKPTVSEHFWEPGAIFLPGHKQAKCVCVCACLQQFEVHSLAYVKSPIRLSSQSPAPVLIFKQLGWEKARHTGKVRPKFRIKKSVLDLCVFDRHILLLKKSHDQVVKGFLILWPGCRLILPCNYVVLLLAEQQTRPHQRRFLPTS